MLFLHGMACVRHDMDLLIDAFAADHRCVAFDLRGHGASDVPVDAYATTDFTDDIGRMIDDLRLDRPVLVGHSFGGSVALAFAAAHPEQVRALVMLDSGLRSSRHRRRRSQPLLRRAARGHADGVPRDRRRLRAHAAVRPGRRPRDRGAGVGADGEAPAHVFLSMAETVTSFDSAGDRRQCAVPSLIIQSRQPFVDPAALATLGDNWDSGRVVGSGHFIQVLVPDQVVAMIRRFLEMQLTR